MLLRQDTTMCKFAMHLPVTSGIHTDRQTVILLFPNGCCEQTHIFISSACLTHTYTHIYTEQFQHHTCQMFLNGFSSMPHKERYKQNKKDGKLHPSSLPNFFFFHAETTKCCQTKKLYTCKQQ